MAGSTECLENMYGYGTGDHIALIGPLPADKVKLKEVLLGYSCYPPAIPKIERDLAEKGRYDCVVQTSWFRGQYPNVKKHLEALGIELQVISMTLQCREPLSRDWSERHEPNWDFARKYL